MSIFSTILSALGLGEKKEEAAQEKPKAAAPARPAPGAAKLYTEKPRAIEAVDVAAKLDALAKANPQELNWKVSIVDLLKLLGIDSSFENRKELAIELGVPKDLLDDSAKMNTWLHKVVLRKIAENGGNVPANLLD